MIIFTGHTPKGRDYSFTQRAAINIKMITVAIVHATSINSVQYIMYFLNLNLYSRLSRPDFSVDFTTHNMTLNTL